MISVTSSEIEALAGLGYRSHSSTRSWAVSAPRGANRDRALGVAAHLGGGGLPGGCHPGRGPRPSPGAFFRKKAGFIEHAWESGLAEMPQLGVVREHHHPFRLDELIETLRSTSLKVEGA